VRSAGPPLREDTDQGIAESHRSMPQSGGRASSENWSMKIQGVAHLVLIMVMNPLGSRVSYTVRRAYVRTTLTVNSS